MAPNDDVRDPNQTSPARAVRGPRRHRRAPRPRPHGLAADDRRRRAWSPSASSPSARRPSTTSPAAPDYYVDRQAIYAVLGMVGMLLLTRIDYSRFRELRVGIYTFLCASVSLVFVFGFAARGSRRAFELPFFSFQPSELGKLLLVLALAGFVIDGARRGSRGSARALPLPRPGTGGARFPAAGPRHLAGVRGRHPRRDVLRRCSLDALRGHRRGSRRA